MTVDLATVFDIDVVTDPVIEQRGYAVRDPYVEMFWLPILGPSAVFMLRRLVLAGQHGATRTTSLEELGLQLGLVRPQVMRHTLNRLERFHVATVHRNRIVVPSHLPPLTEHQVLQLCGSLRLAHRHHVQRQVAA